MARTICFSDRNSQFPYLNGNAQEPEGVPGFLAVFGILVRVRLCYKLPMALENACYYCHPKPRKSSFKIVVLNYFCNSIIK